MYKISKFVQAKFKLKLTACWVNFVMKTFIQRDMIFKEEIMFTALTWLLGYNVYGWL